MAGVYNPGISDHEMVYATMEENAIQYPSKVITFRSYKNIDEHKLHEDINSAPWHVGEIFDSIDDQYYYWNSLLTDVLNEHAPVKRMRVRAKDVPYMTEEWKAAIRMKRKFSKKFAKNPTDENLQLKKSCRNVASKLRRQSLKYYWKKKTEEMNHDARQFFKVFKPFLDSRASVVDDSVILLEKDGMEVKDQTKVAEYFVEYFTEIACEIGDPELLELFEGQLYDYKSVESIRNHKEIDNSPKFRVGKVRQDEVQLALENLKVSKSCGYDGLPNRLLKLISGRLTPSLTQMFNACIQDNYWPVQWKKGEW
ncbi:Hypothetical predicted protein, partial [Paramuricea clavata]